MFSLFFFLLSQLSPHHIVHCWLSSQGNGHQPQKVRHCKRCQCHLSWVYLDGVVKKQNKTNKQTLIMRPNEQYLKCAMKICCDRYMLMATENCNSFYVELWSIDCRLPTILVLIFFTRKHSHLSQKFKMFQYFNILIFH